MSDELTQEEKNQALASGPGSVTVGSSVFLVDKFTAASAFSIYEWSMKEAKKLYSPFREVNDALKELKTLGLDVAEHDKSSLLSYAFRVKIAAEVPADLPTECLRSVGGVAFQLFVLTRTHHATTTCEEIKALITDDNRIDVYTQLDVASGANIVNKALINAGFIRPASPAASAG